MLPSISAEKGCSNFFAGNPKQADNNTMKTKNIFALNLVCCIPILPSVIF